MKSRKWKLQNPENFGLNRAWIVKKSDSPFYTAMIRPNFDYFSPQLCNSLEAAKRKVAKEHRVPGQKEKMIWEECLK